MKINNPIAFPYNDGTGFQDEGMTLRDYFAAKAMQSILSGGINVKEEKYIIEAYDYAAKNAYLISDAMLKQRELC